MARWERRESGGVARLEVPGFIQGAVSVTYYILI